MVVLDAVHQIQATQANDLACRWNCKAGKCGSCSAEINGMPQAHVHDAARRARPEQAGHDRADAAFPLIRDLVTDVSWNFRVKKKIKTFKPRKPDAPTAPGAWRRRTSTACRNSASASNAFCARTSATFFAITKSTRNSSARDFSFTPPRSRCIRWTPKTACRSCKKSHGIGYCNITKCCTKVCPEHITITDNAIIPLKERVVDRYYDPMKKLLRMFSPKNKNE